ncbi:hypothetical protein SJI19_19255 [Acerihabitans sp. TG2]|uniref:hypothetical protein n=1 Tax=Acerihabitans sp. TG2 TaxID=3096008 RepID=UPI002B2323FA|nr:hypothetical protein [Acerihabitans sp. TG2]MEA9392646.1 hypothetical protein [Acerihabitans sp. TG2]
MLRTAKITAAILILLSNHALSSELAKWVFPNNATPVLYPSEMSELPIELAVVNTDTWLVSLLDFRKPGVPGSTCYDGKISESIQTGAPIQINDKYVKFTYVCMGEIGVMQPLTDQGKSFLNELVLSGAEIKIIISENEKLTFPKSDIQAMKKKVSETKIAM